MKYKAYVIESEAGWGSKVDEVKEFDTKQLRDDWVEDYNRKYNPGMYEPNPKVPDWYMKAERAVP